MGREELEDVGRTTLWRGGLTRTQLVGEKERGAAWLVPTAVPRQEEGHRQPWRQ